MNIENLALRQGKRLPSHHDRTLASTYQNAGIGIAEVDADGTLLRVNPHLSQLLGYAPEQLVGRSIFDQSLAEVTAADQEQFDRQVRGDIDHYAIEKRFHR